MAKKKSSDAREKRAAISGNLIAVCKRAQRKKQKKTQRNDYEKYKEIADNPDKKIADELMTAAAGGSPPTTMQKLGMLIPLKDNVAHARMRLRLESDKMKVSPRVTRGFVNIFTALSNYKSQLDGHGTTKVLTEAAMQSMISALMQVSKGIEEAHATVRDAIDSQNRMGIQIDLMEKTLYMSESVLLEQLAKKYDLSYARLLATHNLFSNTPATNKAFIGGRLLRRAKS